MQSDVRIVIVQNHELVRRGMSDLLESHPGWRVVGEAADGDSAIEVIKDLEPDIVTTNFALPGRFDGIALTRWIRQNLPKVRVLAVTMHCGREFVRAVLQAGARGYVMTSDAGRDLIKAVETVLEDKLFFPQTVSELLMDGLGVALMLDIGSRAARTDLRSGRTR